MEFVMVDNNGIRKTLWKVVGLYHLLLITTRTRTTVHLSAQEKNVLDGE
jgi:hypothetical protein